MDGPAASPEATPASEGDQGSTLTRRSGVGGGVDLPLPMHLSMTCDEAGDTALALAEKGPSLTSVEPCGRVVVPLSSLGLSR